MKKHSNLKIPFLITAILVVSSFVPVLQIALLYVNGGISYSIEQALHSENSLMGTIINIVLSAIFLIVYIKSKKVWIQIMGIILSVVFLLPLVYYLLPKINDTEPYFLPGMIYSIIVGAVLIIAGLLKHKG